MKGFGTRWSLTGQLFLTLCLGLTSSKEYSHLPTSGVTKEELPPPILYQTVLPVILEYDLPRWNKADVTFNNWYNCTTETAPYRYTCPIVYHMNQAVLNLHIDFESLTPVQDDLPHTDFYSRLQGSQSFCDSVGPHFSSDYIRQDELNTYIQKLEQCSGAKGLVILERNMPDYKFRIRVPFTTMENRFYNTFYTKITAANESATLDLVASATLSNARTAIQGLLLAHYYAEKNRWTHAVQDCRASMLPHSVVTNAKFRETLDSLTKHREFLDNYDLALPMTLLSKYYGLPIADCSFTNETFVSRILVPVVRKGSGVGGVKLYRLNPLPFTLNGRVCSVILPRGSVYLYDSDRRLAFRTECRPNELCQASKSYNMMSLDPCATAILAGNFNGTKANCPFKCATYSEAGFIEEGLVSRVGSDKFVLGGTDGTSGTVKCEPTLGPDVQVLLVKDQTLELTLPCNCRLVLGRKETFSSELPCGQELQIKQLLPWHLLRRSDDEEMDSQEVALVGVKGSDAPSVEGSQSSATAAHEHVHPDLIEQPSHASLWCYVMFSTLLLLAVQLYILYELNRMKGNGGISSHKWLWRGRDPDSEAGLIE